MGRSKDRMEDAFKKLECSLVLIDLSGFTQMLYQASYKEEVMRTVLLAMRRMFQFAMDQARAEGDVRVINTTGDGFIAIATGRTPSRTAVRYILKVRDHFNVQVKSLIHSVPFRQRADLRIALHHGSVQEVRIDGGDGRFDHVFIGDDLNMISRVINGQVARRFGVAVTRAFYHRLMKSKGELPSPDEVILDRNRYPEQIDIYRLPEKFPDHRST